MRFPDITTRDLEGKERRLPADLDGPADLVVVAFQRWHQNLVDGWQLALGGLRGRYPELEVWEVPSISTYYRLWRPFIDGGMRAGIPDPEVRRHTLTTYTDLDAMSSALGLRTRETIYLFLLDARGEVVWRGEGGFTPEMLQGLDDTLGALLGAG